MAVTEFGERRLLVSQARYAVDPRNLAQIPPDPRQGESSRVA